MPIPPPFINQVSNLEAIKASVLAAPILPPLVDECGDIGRLRIGNRDQLRYRRAVACHSDRCALRCLFKQLRQVSLRLKGAD